ncbi:60S ribosomal protein L6 [Condylostylus longicornis]|uniref:60S ribosomal protein L6 n=1 Tax=Condylostylus longicornis TaxID=2530218 RepID=UPI00244E2A4F|nr:60S ribosomal protein L6 [Condylostylus longicornis]
MAPTEKAKKPAVQGKKKRKHPINTCLGGGIMRYSKSQMYKRRALYRLIGKKSPKVKKEKIPIKVEKKIGGPKNGETRVVYKKKAKANYPTKKRVLKRPPRASFSRHVRNTRKSMVPGRILIMLAGRHQAKRVVLLKVLDTGLLLVTGPFGINSCPLRRVSQRFVIATQTKIDLGKFKVPAHINDKYFARKEVSRKKKNVEGSDIYAAKKEKYVPTEQRKKDQKEVDAVVLKAIKAHPEHKYLVKYLNNLFSLGSNQFPHRMRF